MSKNVDQSEYGCGDALRGIPPRRPAWLDGRAHNPFQSQRQTTPRLCGPNLSQPMFIDSPKNLMTPHVGFEGAGIRNNLLGHFSNFPPPNNFVLPANSSMLTCTNGFGFGVEQFAGYTFSSGSTTTPVVSSATSMASDQRVGVTRRKSLVSNSISVDPNKRKESRICNGRHFEQWEEEEQLGWENSQFSSCGFTLVPI